MVLAAASLGLLFIILALVAFAAAIYLGVHSQWIGALVLLIIGVVILVYSGQA